MVLSDNETDDTIGVLRLGFVALLAPVWLLGGIALVWFGETLFGIGSIVIGLIMIGGGYRLYRAIARPDVVRDERVEEAQYRAGFNAFWSMVLIPSLYVAFSMFLPQAITNQIAQWGGFELAWPVSLVCGFVVYLGSLAYYHFYGL
jgi:hypothetical protein